MHPVMSTRTKSFPIPPDMLAAVKQWAEAAKTSDSEVIRVALAIGLKSLQADPTPLIGRASDLGPPAGMMTAEELRQTPVTDEDPSRSLTDKMKVIRAEREREAKKPKGGKP